MLWERSVVEQRYDAVREVLEGRGVTEVAARYGVSRQSVYTWVGRYRAGGLAGLQDRSHRPNHSPDKTSAEVEAAVCELRRTHPGWGPQWLGWELERRRVGPRPSRVTIWRIGGKGVPETVNGHPRLFVTFTAPSFGKVHSARPKG